MIIIKHKVLLDGFVEVFGQATGDRRFIPLQTRTRASIMTIDRYNSIFGIGSVSTAAVVQWGIIRVPGILNIHAFGSSTPSTSDVSHKQSRPTQSDPSAACFFPL